MPRRAQASVSFLYRRRTLGVASILAALALSACGHGSFATPAPTAEARQPHVYVTTYTQPQPRTDTLPSVGIASVVPDTGAIQWQAMRTAMYPFHQATPSVAGDTVYLIADTIPQNASDTSVPTGFLAATRARDGQTLWTSRLGAFIATPAISNDTVYTSAIVSTGQGSSISRAKWLYALKASDGSKRWQVQIPGGFGLNDAITLADGVLYVASNEVCFDSCDAAYLFAVRASDGKLLWKNTVSGNLNISAPKIDHGVIFLSVPDFTIVSYGLQYAILAYDAASGATLWQRTTYVHGGSSPAPTFVAANGLIYTELGTPSPSDPFRPDRWAYSLAALDGHSGAITWRTPTQLDPTIVGHDAQAIYVQTSTATSSGSIATRALAAYALSDGARRWQAPTDTNLVVYALSDGGLYGVITNFANRNAPVIVEAFSASTGALIWRTPITLSPGAYGGALAAQPVAFLNGAMYVTLSSATLNALRQSDGHALWHKTFDGEIVTVQAVA